MVAQQMVESVQPNKKHDKPMLRLF